MNSIFKFFQGRHTAFGVFFSVFGTILAFMGKLTPEYVALVGAVQALVFAHSAKEAWEEYQAQKAKSNGV